MNIHTANLPLERPVAGGNAEPSQYLAFDLQGEMYLLPLRHVREIIQYRAVAAVPSMPDCVCGIINLRGNVIPVIDLATRFGGSARTPGRRAVILILEIEGAVGQKNYGAIVDAVSEVMALAATDIGPAPTFGLSARTDFIAGVATRGQEVMLALDVELLLAI
jgi:purine-binding chemotaxis protein CheW